MQIQKAALQVTGVWTLKTVFIDGHETFQDEQIAFCESQIHVKGY